MKRLVKKIIIFLVSFFILSPLLYPKENNDIEILTIPRKKTGHDIYVLNNHIVPHYVQIKIENSKIFDTDIQFPYEIIISPKKEKQFVFSLIPRKGIKSYELKVKYHYVKGAIHLAKHTKRDLHIYYHTNMEKNRKVSQSFNTNGTHQGENAYAVDFDMPVGTPVYATRSGIVVEIKENSTQGGISPSFAKYNNYISIMHEDGTFANYSHLKYNGALVQVGDQVKAGRIK